MADATVAVDGLEALQIGRDLTAEVALVAVFILAESQSARRGELEDMPICRIITQPITLRDVRKELQLGLKEVLSQSRLIKLPPIP